MRLIWQLYPPFFFVLLVALAALTLYDAASLKSVYEHETDLHLERLARVLAFQVLPYDAATPVGRYEEIARKAGRASSYRVTILSAEGTVLGDSEVDPASMDNHHDRREIREALAGRVGHVRRFSFTTQRETAYVAVPAVRDGQTVAIVRVGVDAKAAAGAMRHVYLRLLLGTLLVALVAVGLSLLAVRRLARQIEAVKQYAEGYARDETAARLPVSDSFELAGLANALNRMGARFAARMEEILRQRNELDSVLTGMIEGVIAVDLDARVINLNDTAAKLLSTTRAEACGRTIQEVIRNTSIQRLVAKTLEGSGPVEADITLFRDGERTLKGRGTVLRDGAGRAIGGLLVLDDVTKLRRLEAARRDFVANVSHEIRTPITSIQGYVETLLEGALEDRENAERFLRIVHAQAGRLNALVNDLLTLARLEQDQSPARLAREPVRIKELIDDALRICEPLATNLNVKIDANCDPDLRASLNAALAEQALVNLLDNAIKFSEAGGGVEVSAAHENGEVVIRVRDHGCGIERQHLSRLFERFYRVDRARSRKQGGTGLGLAIVKHIAILHKGRATVESTPGEGSTFALYFPRD
ncbi:MAG: ATP-binding protein [FCB group bacterium]|jgi:two-component system phosphate regulon sensor histidine kinase PhoR|nr:ATP-binding protein [FCB group bacterium]